MESDTLNMTTRDHEVEALREKLAELTERYERLQEQLRVLQAPPKGYRIPEAIL